MLRRAVNFVGKLALWSIVIGMISVAAGLIYMQHLVVHYDVNRDSVIKKANHVWALVSEHATNFDVHVAAPLHLPASRIPAHLRDAVILAEDRRFPGHPGIDPVGMARAMWGYARHGLGLGPMSGGGSTITQQLVKNVLLSNDRTVERKIKEALLAVHVERLFGKDEILAMYLNNIHFGNGKEGVEAAARFYFGRSVAYPNQGPTISPLEAAMLALTIRRPVVNPRSERAFLEGRAVALLAQMRDAGSLTAEQFAAAIARKGKAPGPAVFRLSLSHFRDFMMDPSRLKAIDALPRPIVAYGTIEPEASLYAEKAVGELLSGARRIDPAYDDAAILIMRPDGALVAMATARTYAETSGFNAVTSGRRSPASTIKPFVYLCALEDGAKPTDLVRDEAREFAPGWIPRNFDGRYMGPITLVEALAASRNPPAVELWTRHGRDCLPDMLGKAGLDGTLPDTPTAALGNAAVPLMDIVSWYAAIANGGHAVTPYTIWSVRSASGETVYRHDPTPGPRIASHRSVCTLTGMLRRVVSARGTGAHAAFGHPVAGKTGTSDKGRDAYFVGFTGQYVAGIWLGATRKAPVRAIGGGDLPARTFRRMMATLHEGKDVVSLDCGTELAGQPMARG